MPLGLDGITCVLVYRPNDPRFHKVRGALQLVMGCEMASYEFLTSISFVLSLRRTWTLFLKGCVEEDGEDAVAPPDSNSITAFAPLQKLPDPCSGREVHALALKQITSLGALSWLQSLCTDDAVVQDTSTSTKNSKTHKQEQTPTHLQLFSNPF